LQPVRFPERFLYRMKGFGIGRQAFDSSYLAAACLHGEEQTRANRLTIQDNRTCSTDAVFAADMGSGQSQLVPDKIA
jgi:hypothetical protein